SDSSGSSGILATHQIFQIFERSKMQVDDDLDSLPGIYAVIDSEGRIYKGNKTLGNLLGTDHEYLLERRITELFSKKDWDIVKKQLTEDITPQNAPVDIQADVTLQGVRYNYIWNLYPISSTRRNDIPPLMTIIGRDITERVLAVERN